MLWLAYILLAHANPWGVMSHLWGPATTFATVSVKSLPILVYCLQGSEWVRTWQHHWTPRMGSISHYKITKWIVGFIREPKGLIGRSQLFKASHANESRPGYCFPEWTLSKARIHCQRSAVSPRKTMHCHTITSNLIVVLHPLMHFLP